MTDVNHLIAKISKETGKTQKEIKEMMDNRKDATHGLLSDYGAVYAVAKELNIPLKEGKIILNEIKDIKPQKPVNVYGRAKVIYPLKEFKRKDGSQGKMASIILLDQTGEIRLLLWDKNSRIAKQVQVGDSILVRNGYGKEGLDGSVEVHASSLTTISINPNLNVELPQVKEKKQDIKNLSEGLSSVNLVCRVSSYYPPTEFVRSDGSTGKRASFIGEDGTGKIRVVLWDSSAETDLSTGDTVKLENAYTRKGLNDELELQAGNRSRVILTEKELDLPPLEDGTVGDIKITEIKPDISGFTTEGRILQVFQPRSFSGGSMASLIISDGEGTIRVVLWGGKSEIANELKKDDAVKIRNAYSKANLNDEPEVHVGNYGSLSLNQETELPSMQEIEKSLVNKKDIIDLESKDRYVQIKGTIVHIDDEKRIIYYTCQSCGRSVQNTGLGWYCESCNDDVEPVSNLVLSFTVEDGTGSIRAISFKESAEKVLGMDVEEVMNLIRETQDELAPLKEMEKTILDQEISLMGRVKYSDFSDQLEFIVDDVV
ncbi:MAG: OB-fold nucleic acid binding domain-containing protein [Candidatus Altiarchaeota archaeon]|nr:OB-fold nucleic acid binding domain-containing protein [Candidatus Altiarchaeota archaeon]